MAHLALSFLGAFQAELDGRPLTEFKSNKVRALLAYLAVESGRPHRREALAGLLWPDRPDRDALSNLRYTLASLRRTLGDRAAHLPFLLITYETIQFNGASDHWLDVAELEQTITGNRAQRQLGDDLKSILALYRSPFLEGFSVSAAAPFEEWVLFRREQLVRKVTAALGDLVADLEARADLKEAQIYARRQVDLEPWNEEAHRALMRILARDGQRTAALHQFQACQRILHDELSVEPAEETVALYDALRRGEEINEQERGEASRRDKRTGRQRTSEPFLSTSLFGSPLVLAREAQLSQLNAHLAQALTGKGLVVFVTGEAGSGKTALLSEFANRAMEARPDVLAAAGACDAVVGIGDPYLPFREILQLLTGDIEPKRAGTTLIAEHARRLWAAMPDAVQALAEHGPGLIDTLVPRGSLELRVEAFVGWTGGDMQRRQLRQAIRQSTAMRSDGSHPFQKIDFIQEVTEVLQALALRHPLVLVLDDLQWADASSLSLLFHLGRRLGNSRILVVAAFRPDAIDPQPEANRRAFEVIFRELQRFYGIPTLDLDACEGRQLVDALLDVQPNRFDARFREQLFGHTEGHPLFTVELLQGLAEQGDLLRGADGTWSARSELHWERLPTRVEAVIAERIARLPSRCHEVLSVASVEGDEFTAEAAARVLDVDERTIVNCLNDELAEKHRLVVAVSLQRLGARRLSRFRFRHALFRQYLYDHLNAVRRVEWHEAVGNALEQLVGDTPEELETLVPRLAWHFDEAGLAERAATYHLQAGRRAAHLAAHEDAISHLTRGLALLEPSPESPERVNLKLDLLVALEVTLGLERSFWAPERMRAVEQAYELAQHPAVSTSPQRGMALAAVAGFAMWSADFGRAEQVGSELLCLAESTGNTHHRMVAHFLLGTVQWLRGEPALARKHLDSAIALYDRRSYHPQDTVFGSHAGILSLVWQSAVLWMLGYPDQATRCLQEGLAAAEQSNHPITLAFARAIAAMCYFVIGRDPTAGWQQVDALHRLRKVSPAMVSWADSLPSRRLTGPGPDGREGLERMRRGLDDFEALGGALGRAAQLMMLAQSYAQAGQVDRGLEAIAEALVWIDRTGVTDMQAEAYRLRGELLAAEQPHQSEACFRRAIAIAREQEARWWELRATASLCRLLKKRSPEDASRVEAQQLLAEIYGWFCEGFTTRDLQEAFELLQE